MEPGTPAGHEARLQAIERNEAEIFRRLRVVDRLDERSQTMAHDLAEVKDGLSSCVENCQLIRNYVDNRLKEEGEKRRLSRGEIVTFLGLAVATLSAIFAMLASLGVFSS